MRTLYESGNEISAAVVSLSISRLPSQLLQMRISFPLPRASHYLKHKALASPASCPWLLFGRWKISVRRGFSKNSHRCRINGATAALLWCRDWRTIRSSNTDISPTVTSSPCEPRILLSRGLPTVTSRSHSDFSAKRLSCVNTALTA